MIGQKRQFGQAIDPFLQTGSQLSLLNTDTLPVLYKALVWPIIEYGNLVSRPFSNQNIKRVESVQDMLPKLSHL